MSSLEKLLYSMDEAAEMLTLSRSALNKLVRAEVIPTATIGGRRLVSRRVLEEYVDGLIVQAKSQILSSSPGIFPLRRI